MEPNKYQKAIYDFIVNGKGNAVVNAVAGSGKTTTIVTALNYVDPSKKVLFLAFNKSIVTEIKQRVGYKPNVTICTLHSLGLRACRCYTDKINEDKYPAYINAKIKEGFFQPTHELETKAKKNWVFNIKELCDLGRIELVKDAKELAEAARKHDIITEDNEATLAMDVIEWGKTYTSEIDFTDMIYYPNVIPTHLPKFDFVFIDECQDLNAAQREMFLKCVRKGGRFVAVGDVNQAIYFFSGADAESFNKLTQIPNTIMLPLSVCYRCDKDIIIKAKKLVPQIEYRDGAGDGVIDLSAKLDDIKEGDLVICRVTSPLISLCMYFLKKGIKSYIKGRDLGMNLVTMLMNTKQEKAYMAMDVLHKEAGKLLKKICDKYGYDEDQGVRTSTYQNYIDKVTALEQICKRYTYTNDVIDIIKKVFADDQTEGICLSTIHRSKGLENERVFILNEDKLYPFWAMGNSIQAIQEKNIEYVAITRAKKYLGYVRYEDSFADDDEEDNPGLEDTTNNNKEDNNVTDNEKQKA